MGACCFYILFLNVSLFVIFFKIVLIMVFRRPPRIGLFPQIQLSEAVEPPGLDFRMQVKKKFSSGGSTASEICIWKNSQYQGVRENQIISTVLV